MTLSAAAVTRALVGEPLRSDRLHETLLPKRLALPVFCSDPLSSVAYATEQMILVLTLGGLGLLHLTPWLGGAVALLLVIVVASYRQTCSAYPNGGGAYAVSRANLGEDASLVAASALLIDYVLTVAVSVVAGVAAITSAVPELAPHAVGLSVAFVVIVTLANLRGVKESGRAFAIPTYGFVAAVFVLLAVGFARIAFGDGITAESAHYDIRAVAGSGGPPRGFFLFRGFAPRRSAVAGRGGQRRARRRVSRVAGVCLRLYGVDRRGGGVQRRAGVCGAEEPQRRGHAGDHGCAGDRDVRRHHGAGAGRARAHGRGRVGVD